LYKVILGVSLKLKLIG